MEVTATAKQIRMSPRKMRPVANAVRGKSLEDAYTILQVSEKQAARHIRKLVESAEANASHNHNLTGEHLYVHTITVDENGILKRVQPRAMGGAGLLRKRLSQVHVALAEKTDNS